MHKDACAGKPNDICLFMLQISDVQHLIASHKRYQIYNNSEESNERNLLPACNYEILRLFK